MVEVLASHDAMPPLRLLEFLVEVLQHLRSECIYIYIYLASMQTTKKGIRIWDVFDVFCTFQSSWRCFLVEFEKHQQIINLIPNFQRNHQVGDCWFLVIKLLISADCSQSLLRSLLSAFAASCGVAGSSVSKRWRTIREASEKHQLYHQLLSSYYGYYVCLVQLTAISFRSVSRWSQVQFYAKLVKKTGSK